LSITSGVKHGQKAFRYDEYLTPSGTGIAWLAM
jgi:hypothetical protein